MITYSAREPSNVEYSIRHMCETWSPSINRARGITHNGFGRWSISKCGRGNSSTAARLRRSRPRRKRQPPRGCDDMKIVLLSRVPRWYSFRADRVIRRLARDGHEILAVVAERSSTSTSLREWLWKYGPRLFVEKSVRKLLRLAGLKRAPQGGAGGRPERPGEQIPTPPVYFVDSHNSEKCVELVFSLRPDALVWRGCGILKRPILATAWLGAINPHYATLPAYRGVDVTEWAALHGDPVAVSVHFVTEHVDTGSVIVSREILVEPGDTTGELRDKSAALAVELLAEALNKLDAGVAGQTASPGAVGRQYFAMHSRLRQLA